MKKPFGKSFIVSLALAAGVLSSCGGKEDQISPPKEASELSLKVIPESPKAGDAIKAVAYGVSGGPAVYHWEINGSEVAGVAGEALPKEMLRKGDSIKVRVVSGNMEASAEVSVVNSPPRLRSLGISPARFGAGVDLTAVAEGFDPDGDHVVYDYLWSINGERAYTATGSVLDGKSYKRGDKIKVRVVPRDSEGPGEPLDAEAGYVINSPPMFKSAPPRDFAGNFIYSVETADPDGDEVKLAIEKSPKGMKLEGTKIVWDAKDEKNSFEVVLSADDGNGGRALQEFALTIKRD